MGRFTRYYLGEDKLKDILKSAGVTIVNDTGSNWLCLCCFHKNLDSPAMTFESQYPYRFKCWNGSCNKTGNLISLLSNKGYSKYEIKKILQVGIQDDDNFTSYINSILFPKDEINPWIKDSPERFIESDADWDYIAKNYLLGRGITEQAYEYFKIGYSPAMKMMVVPIFDKNNKFIGVIGRSIEGKNYRYSTGFERSSTIWNIQNSIHSNQGSIILTEGSLDSVYIWQAGWENVGAVFGSTVSKRQIELIRTYFHEVIAFFDNDEAGRHCAEGLIKNLPDLQVSTVEYPEGVKDSQDLTHDQINDMIRNRKSSVQHLLENGDLNGSY